MPRLSIPPRDEVPPSTRVLLDELYTHFAMVPAVHRLLATSPAILAGFLALGSAIESRMDIRLRLRIAIAVSQANGCDYCLSVNRFVALNHGRISLEEIELNRQGCSGNAKADAAVHFASEVVRQRGRVADADLERLRTAGYQDPEIVEIVALVGHCTLANFLNEVAQTDIDFPALRTYA